LNNFLWYEDQPIILNENIQPDTTIHQDKVLDTKFLDFFGQLIQYNKDSILVNHPEVMSTQYKIKSLNLDLDLYNDRLKPQLNLTYNVINEYLDWDGLNQDVGYLRNNYKAGLEFNFPIFLRKERGDIDATETKIQETEFNLNNKIINLKNKIEQESNNLDILKQNFVYSQQIRNNYRTLLNAEEIKFELGESSIFLINSREMKYLESEIKLIETDIKTALQYFKYLYVNGILYQL
jgi:outer membrane protein TolC